jgi:exosortase
MAESVNSIPKQNPGSAIARFEWGLAILLVGVFAPAVIALAEIWLSVDYYSHGFLVPVVAYWASTQARTRFVKVAPRDSRGFLVLVLALCGYGLGSAAGLPLLQGFALVAAMVACVLYLGGATGLRTLAFPLSFTLFMVPLPPSWITPAIVWLQLIVSETAVVTMGWIGSEVTRAGNVILLPGGESLFVAEACSGITSIVTLFPLAVMLGYFTLPTLPRKLILMAAVIPAAMLGNGLRVAATVAAAERFGAEAATGNWLHESAGVLTFALACFALIAIGGLMRRAGPRAAIS